MHPIFSIYFVCDSRVLSNRWYVMLFAHSFSLIHRFMYVRAWAAHTKCWRTEFNEWILSHFYFFFYFYFLLSHDSRMCVRLQMKCWWCAKKKPKTSANQLKIMILPKIASYKLSRVLGNRAKKNTTKTSSSNEQKCHSLTRSQCEWPNLNFMNILKDFFRYHDNIYKFFQCPFNLKINCL
jgi:hypothetical protein